jgi:L-glyceraldehyde 3-phosphate reductase
MALSWILKDDEVCSVLIGASRPEQILENISIVENTAFTKEELEKIDQICQAE